MNTPEITPNAMNSLLLFVALREARRYKWEQSERSGRDLGQEPVIAWFKAHWTDWYRDHWVEHITGKHFWEEFGKDEFDVVHKCPEIIGSYPDNSLVEDITKHVSNHGENLGIIIWARNTGQDMDKVLSILKTIDINGRRAEIEDAYLETLSNALDEADKYKWIESERAGRDLGQEAIMNWFRVNWVRWTQEYRKG